jgi:hypothetical protein
MKRTSTKSIPDDGLEWLRDIRRKMAAESKNDPKLMGRKIRELERKYASRMFKTRRIVEGTGGK